SLAVLTAVAVGSVLAGTLAVAWAMVLDQHDLGVVTTVCVIAGVSATATALLLGRWVIGGNRELERAARALGETGETAGTGPAYGEAAGAPSDVGGEKGTRNGNGRGGRGSAGPAEAAGAAGAAARGGFVAPTTPMPAELASLSRQL